MPGLTLGVSLLTSAGSSVTSAYDASSDDLISEDDTSSQTVGFLAGVRGFALERKMTTAVALKLPSTTTTKGTTRLPPLGEDAVIDKDGTAKGPLGIGIGASYYMDGVRPFFEYVREQWKALRSQEGFTGVTEAPVDYFDTNDIKLGVDYGWGPHRVTGAFATYQSHLGDGIMKELADDGEEIIGMEFQNLDAIPYRVFAGGYRYAYSDGYFQTGVSYLNGKRDVWEKARGYGDYELTILTVVAGGVYRF
jgi:hypothetical protein